MFEPGRILQVGGGGTPASRNANIIDINTGTPRLTALPQAQFGRHWGNATVMADGRVLVSGGSAENNVANGVAYTTEIFNPANELVVDRRRRRPGCACTTRHRCCFPMPP